MYPSDEVNWGVRLFLMKCIICGNVEDYQILINREDPPARKNGPLRSSMGSEFRRCACECGRILPTRFSTRKYFNRACYYSMAMRKTRTKERRDREPH